MSRARVTYSREALIAMGAGPPPPEPPPEPPPAPRYCSWCDRSIDEMRRGTIYCSSSCRAHAWRESSAPAA